MPRVNFRLRSTSQMNPRNSIGFSSQSSRCVTRPTALKAWLPRWSDPMNRRCRAESWEALEGARLSQSLGAPGYVLSIAISCHGARHSPGAIGPRRTVLVSSCRGEGDRR
jgi:hypothetical protein